MSLRFAFKICRIFGFCRKSCIFATFLSLRDTKSYNIVIQQPINRKYKIRMNTFIHIAERTAQLSFIEKTEVMQYADYPSQKKQQTLTYYIASGKTRRSIHQTAGAVLSAPCRSSSDFYKTVRPMRGRITAASEQTPTSHGRIHVAPERITAASFFSKNSTFSGAAARKTSGSTQEMKTIACGIAQTGKKQPQSLKSRKPSLKNRKPSGKSRKSSRERHKSFVRDRFQKPRDGFQLLRAGLWLLRIIFYPVSSSEQFFRSRHFSPLGAGSSLRRK